VGSRNVSGIGGIAELCRGFGRPTLRDTGVLDLEHGGGGRRLLGFAFPGSVRHGLGRAPDHNRLHPHPAQHTGRKRDDFQARVRLAAELHGRFTDAFGEWYEPQHRGLEPACPAVDDRVLSGCESRPGDGADDRQNDE